MKFFRCFSFFFILLATSFLSYANPIDANINNNTLTKEEQAYIHNHPIIKVHALSDEVPYDFIKDGKLQGFSIDHINLVASKVGLKVNFITGYTWNQYLEQLKNGKIDVMLNIVRNKSRDQYFAFTQSFITVMNTVFTNQKLHPDRLDDLNGKIIAIVKGFSEIKILEKLYPKIHLLFMNTQTEAFKMVSLGKADAVIEYIGVGSEIILKYGLDNVIPAFEIADPAFQINLHLATNKNNTILRDILQKGINLTTEEEMHTLTNKWLIDKTLYNKFRINYRLIEYALTIIVIAGLIFMYRYFILKKSHEELYKSQEKLKLMATTDSMTNLYNRRHFQDVAQSLISLSKRNQTDLALMMIDIDHFKKINDTYGHNIGDATLILFSDKLKNICRNSDLPCRWGGEEFLLLLPSTNLEGALSISEKLRIQIEHLSMPVPNKTELTFTISIGVSLFDSNKDEKITDLANRADKALYAAKASGRNRVCIA